MNILLWVLQVLAALLYGASGVMKVFLFDKVSEGVPSFGAMSREAWKALGILELVCTVGLIVLRRPSLASGAHDSSRRHPGDREPRVHLGALQVPREHAHHHERRAWSPYGVPRVRPDGPEADLLNGAPSHKRALCDPGASLPITRLCGSSIIHAS